MYKNRRLSKRKGEVDMLILGNGRMITRDADNPYLECGAVVIDGTKIVKAGTLSEVKAAYSDAEFLDAKGKVIMPAFINAHEHIYSAFARWCDNGI